ncbi:unnamed protein product [Caenorhabditis angaria]|uniref:FF domain-containing protein n=1 Tax=Caenorhabditis angaria TaxID=860376 RepID=A0A9P1ILS0_9PELO|nr:unnamed protein product [Caenorhabditis angaria]
MKKKKRKNEATPTAKDEKRLAIKKAKEDLEKFLQENRQVKETLKYSKACEIFGKEPIWQAVNDEDRHDIFRDCLKFVAKRDEEKKKEVQTKNIQSLSAILQSMDQITYKTTWAQAQRLLIENPAFANDTTLQIMDKEDALIVFEEHIKAAEIEHIEQKKLESKRLRRQERKVREQFQQLLAELHKKGELTSVSLWKDLFSGISADHRFDAMLLQSGSTPLDLFKFFVEDLKEQYTEDRKRIKEILAEKNLEVRPNTEYDLFSEWVLSHPNGGKVDHGNMKLCYNSMIEKAESKVKDEEREIARKKRRIENEYKGLLKAQEVGIETDWNVLKGNIEKEKAYEAVGSEEECEKLFRDYVTALNEACHHIHAPSNGEKSKKKKKDKKKKSKKEERADSESEGEIREKKKKKKHSKDRSDDEMEKKRRHESDSN